MNLNDKIEAEGWIRNMNIVDEPEHVILNMYSSFLEHHTKYKPTEVNPSYGSEYSIITKLYALESIRQLYGDKE